MSGRRRDFGPLRRAFDEARFGASHTLNLRASLPSAYQAAARVEAWLREKQIARVGEVLVITGRGNQSPGHVSPVGEAIARLLTSLKRRGVVVSVHEHTPGSFVVELAPVSALRQAPRRRRERTRAEPGDPEALSGLSADTRRLLRRLALRALEELGVQNPAPFLESEMLAQFAAIAPGIREGSRREMHLREAITAALDEYANG
jgi:hypothetical protein